MTDDIEERIKRLEYAIWGLRGDNGMVSDLKALRLDFAGYLAAEQLRRDNDTKTQRSRDRALVLAVCTILVMLLGIIAALIGGHP